MGMSNQIDDLFRKKLEGHSVEPGPLTWSRISARFIKKNRILIGYRAAAAIALMAAAFWLYDNARNASPSNIAKVAPRSAGVEKPLVAQEKENKTTREDAPPTMAPVPQKAGPLVAKKTKIPHTVETVGRDKGALMELAHTPIAPIAQATIVPLQNGPETGGAETMAGDKPIVIVYELKPFTKETSGPQDEFDQPLQKKTGLKKVLDVANNLRTGESPLNSLRQAKEELFAWNFRKENKDNSNNK